MPDLQTVAACMPAHMHRLQGGKLCFVVRIKHARLKQILKTDTPYFVVCEWGTQNLGPSFVLYEWKRRNVGPTLVVLEGQNLGPFMWTAGMRARMLHPIQPESACLCGCGLRPHLNTVAGSNVHTTRHFLPRC
eukprot:365292-Chlamydomonas_euryale.AAC.5